MTKLQFVGYTFF